MKRISPVIWKIAYSLGLIMLAIQAALGLCWIASHFLRLPSFAETETLIKASQDWRIDEYMGALYVALIAAFRWVEGMIGIPFQVPLYLLQLLLGLHGVYALLGVFGERKNWRVWAVSIYVNTIPFLLQTHFSVLPYSLGGSLYFMLVAVLVKMNSAMKAREEQVLKKVFLKYVCQIVLLWALSSLVLPEYYVLSGLLVVLGVLYGWLGTRTEKEQNRQIMNLRGWLVTVVVTGALLSGLCMLLTVQEGSRDRMQNTVAAQAVRRMAWPELFRMNDLWATEIKDTFSLQELSDYSAVPERVIEGFGPALEDKYGKEKANQIYTQMAYTAVTTNTKAVVKQVSRDLAFFTCPPLAVSLDLKGLGGTYTGWNYEKLQENTVVLTDIYVECSVLTFLVFGALALGRLFCSKLKKGKLCWLFATIIIMHAVSSTWLTGGMVSYLRCPVNMALWGCAFCFWLIGQNRMGEVETK